MSGQPRFPTHTYWSRKSVLSCGSSNSYVNISSTRLSRCNLWPNLPSNAITLMCWLAQAELCYRNTVSIINTQCRSLGALFPERNRFPANKGFLVGVFLWKRDKCLEQSLVNFLVWFRSYRSYFTHGLFSKTSYMALLKHKGATWCRQLLPWALGTSTKASQTVVHTESPKFVYSSVHDQ